MSSAAQVKRPWAETFSENAEHDGSSDDMASNSPSAVSVRHPIATNHTQQDEMGWRRVQEQVGSDSSVLGNNKRSCSGTGTTASPATTSLFLRSSSPEQAYDSRETQHNRRNAPLELVNRFRKRVTIIQPISHSWESDAGAGRQKLQVHSSFEPASALSHQPPSPPSWRSFATVNAAGFDAQRQLQPGRFSPPTGKTPNPSVYGTPLPQERSNVGFQSVRRSGNRGQAPPHQTWPRTSDVLPPIPPLFATGVAAAAASLLALGDVSMLPVALLSPYSPPSSHSLVAAHSATDMANNFLRQNPHLLASAPANMARAASPFPPAFPGPVLHPGSHYQADSPAGGMYTPSEDAQHRLYKTSPAGSPAWANESMSPSKYAANSPNSSPEPASRDSGDARMEGSGSGSNGTSGDSSGSPGRSGSGTDSTSEPAGSLVQVHSQLNQLYQWYCNNKEVYMHQARKGLDNLERNTRFAAAHTYNSNAGRLQHEAAPSVAAGPSASALAQQTADVQRAIAKAMQIMQASSEVERQARPDAGVIGRAGGPQFGRDATHTAVALALSRVAAATGGLKQQGQPLQVQA